MENVELFMNICWLPIDYIGPALKGMTVESVG